MPKSTPAGFLIGILGGIFAFAMVWHIWWLAILGFLGMVGVFIWRSCDDEIDYTVTADQIAAIEGSPEAQRTSGAQYHARALSQ